MFIIHPSTEVAALRLAPGITSPQAAGRHNAFLVIGRSAYSSRS